ncbi:Cyclin T1 [Quillaja saponaria]|uniref:B-like cyclin n=1 Tax=Quillaja saponaria TaxID=32244 RepID=A0AAD7QEK8_QUISA|nr:Cyclin T1 [Quillaja saponaria]KAJ7980069.1 Cyclin T1 [Quillaja saponaria]
MACAWNFHSQGDTYQGGNLSSFDGSNFSNSNRNRSRNNYHNRNYTNFNDYSVKFREQNDNCIGVDNSNYVKHNGFPFLKRRRYSNSTWGESGQQYFPPSVYDNVPSSYNNPAPSSYSNPAPSSYSNPTPSTCSYPAPSSCSNPPPPLRTNADTFKSSNKRDRSRFEDEEPVFLSRDEIERHSPSRKDGIDALRETHLRYSYCAFLQNLGMRLELPQTTIGTAMVLCHRFFVRRSHACHDRFLISTAALFLTAKSEETARPLNDVLRASSEIIHKNDFTLLSYMLPIDWFEQYRERVLEAEQMILTTLNFELNVQHPYASLTSILNKLGLSETVLVNLALNLVSEGLRSSLWLQFKPHHIAAGAAYLAAKLLNMDLAAYQNIWQEFKTTPSILHEVTQQLMELF